MPLFVQVKFHSKYSIFLEISCVPMNRTNAVINELITIAITSAHTDDSNKTVYITVRTPIQIPTPASEPIDSSSVPPDVNIRFGCSQLKFGNRLPIIKPYMLQLIVIKKVIAITTATT